jgi:hypothetical protein
VKLIIDLIPAKHNMSKNLYQSKKIVSSLKMNYEKIDAYEKKSHVVLQEARYVLSSTVPRYSYSSWPMNICTVLDPLAFKPYTDQGTFQDGVTKMFWVSLLAIF